MKTRFCQKLKMVSGKVNPLIQGFSHLIGKIQKALDKRVPIIGIFIDLTKAYDVLNHKLLLEKLFYYGIRGSTNFVLKTESQYCPCLGNRFSSSDNLAKVQCYLHHT